ncbi:hypothetical protein ASE17_20475 [Phenylobacterium sp. Root77]|jgi:RNA polymerase sigma factor (sigma-70 family)|uniref:RNA polymerase sigma factor n=1 Tax=unclassified Phenylobacterium TaxID=2640670 RepID=UPI000700A9BE|nr:MULTISPECIES: RNA polymerase sigma factor [unclassified Phenylobacterium]KQW67045.1 hypothetical protein ASC73_18130 [Phenylobacterium sp. Root1277]KQW89738.1 hypothetical protein ASC79_19035 [Phenylobacterium sp. Root1290]KRC43573.1 hypothetical protein ASE17_20475 [Phenylobacterium sp. Root77]
MAEQSTPIGRPIGEDSAAAQDSRPSLATLFQLHARWLRALMLRHYDIDADDVVQETYIRLAPFHAANEIRHPQALLARVAHNLARNKLRAEANRRRITSALERQYDLAGGADAPDQLEALLFKQAILSLPPIFRDVMVLSRFTGLSNTQVAERLGVSVKTVEWRLTRALALCAKQLED